MSSRAGGTFSLFGTDTSRYLYNRTHPLANIEKEEEEEEEETGIFTA